VRVLSFADTRFPIERANGVQTMATCHALAARGHDVTLVVRPDTTRPARDPFAFYGLSPLGALHIRTVPAPGGGRTRRARFLVAALGLAAAQPDAVVYTRDLGLAAFLLQVPSARRPRIVYESHGVSAAVSEAMPALLGKPDLAPSPRKLRRLDRRERRVWQHAQACVTITQALADELASRYGSRPDVFVVPDGARLPDAGAAAATADTPPGAPVAAYAGHLYPWKGVDVFVRALALAPGVAGLIVGGHPGEADRARIEGLVAQLGLADRVTITGLVPPGDVRNRLAGATMLVLPNTATAISARYSSPLKLFEYLTLGRPIVASDLPAIREVLTDGRTALLVPPDDPAALAAALTRLAADAGLRASLGAGARALAPAYTWDARAGRLESALEAARAR
jgi:glycosyltransferase involved in cell wall biosynthesis